jgi:hypothetical protein
VRFYAVADVIRAILRPANQVPAAAMYGWIAELGCF